MTPEKNTEIIPDVVFMTHKEAVYQEILARKATYCPTLETVHGVQSSEWNRKEAPHDN
jgi:hypothetical protein